MAWFNFTCNFAATLGFLKFTNELAGFKLFQKVMNLISWKTATSNDNLYLLQVHDGSEPGGKLQKLLFLVRIKACRKWTSCFFFLLKYTLKLERELKLQVFHSKTYLNVFLAICSFNRTIFCLVDLITLSFFSSSLLSFFTLLRSPLIPKWSLDVEESTEELEVAFGLSPNVRLR